MTAMLVDPTSGHTVVTLDDLALIISLLTMKLLLLLSKLTLLGSKAQSC